ncbi:Cell wall-active antibiotics response 4TMS YvqF [Alteromonadaceae bacterium Bs31]|nr:Cell wall-active antibiotics response 4TMS YvqF [Alteromonadaceae bacterium Bs31]
MSKNSPPIKPHSFIGLVLIALAALLLLHNIGFKLVGIVFKFWPVLVIAAGIIMLANKKPQQRAGVLPYALIIVGGLFLLAQLNLFNLSIGTILLPLLLFLAGYHFLRQGKLVRGCGERNRLKKLTDAVSGLGEHADKNTLEADGSIDIYAILGGGDYNTRSHKLASGNIVCVMGGAQLDMREADTQQDVIQIDVLAVMGGAEIKVPPHWEVTAKVLPLLGGVSNKTTCMAEKLGLPKKHLVITGLALMGGVEVRN